MADTKKSFTSPVGRIVAGSLYKPQTTDIEGKPKVYSYGPNLGQPKVDYFVAVAIPKGAETHWSATAWGAIIWQVGHTFFPQAAQSPSFSWKVDDGDSQIPNSAGRKNCEREGQKGHWVLKLTSLYAPTIYTQEGNALPVQITQEDYIKAGYYVQVVISPDTNKSDLKPGVKLYYSMVCLRGYGPEISFGPDVASAGFGAAPLPVGASALPLASSVPMPTPGVTAPPPPPAPAAPVALPVPVVPLPGFLTGAIPAVPTAVPVPPPPPVAAGPKMTAKAGGSSYQAWIQGGWDDAALVREGYMTL